MTPRYIRKLFSLWYLPLSWTTLPWWQALEIRHKFFLFYINSQPTFPQRGVTKSKNFNQIKVIKLYGRVILMSLFGSLKFKWAYMTFDLIFSQGDPNVFAGELSLKVDLRRPMILTYDQQERISTMEEIDTPDLPGDVAIDKLPQQPFRLPFDSFERDITPPRHCRARWGTPLYRQTTPAAIKIAIRLFWVGYYSTQTLQSKVRHALI